MLPNHRILSTIALTVALGIILPYGQAQSADGVVKLNQIQVIGTHNSYHAGIAPNESKLWQAKYADAYKGLDYQHQPLPQQFDSGVRQIELDVYADTQGGLYAHPSGPKSVAAASLPADPDFDPNGLMNKPGFKVMHVQDVDYRSTCQPFIGCLEQIKEWSHAHPNHVPIFILVETKQDKPGRENKLHLTETEPFTSRHLRRTRRRDSLRLPCQRTHHARRRSRPLQNPQPGRPRRQLAHPCQSSRQGRLPHGPACRNSRLP